MKLFITENQFNQLVEEFSFNKKEMEDKIMRLHDLPKEYKEFAVQYVQYITDAGKGKVSGLIIPPNFAKSLKDRNLPDGFSVGVDKNGYYIHTHRARSKSHETLDKITQKEIKFINSTE